MRHSSTSAIRSILIGALLLSGGALAGRAMTPQDQDAAAMPGAPGEMHAAMMQFAGSFTTETTFKPTPDAESMVSKGTAEMTPALGGRFLVEKNKGTFMGQPFEGMNLWGYNSGSDEFEACWTWTNSTGILFMSGTIDNEAGVTNWNASYRDETGAKKEMRLLSRLTAEGHFIVEMFAPMPEGEGEYPLMVIEYVRK